MDFFKQVFDFIKYQSKNTLPQTQGAFRAWVDAIIPVTPEFAEKQGFVQSFGALDSHIDEYEIWSLDNYLSLNILIDEFNIDLANLTAGLMNTAAKQLIHIGGNKKPVNQEIESEAGTFAALAPSDRFRAINLLEQLDVDFESLPIPFNIYPNFVFNSSVSIAILTLIGYYTEWSGYGSTRLETPEKRKLEHFPTGWAQVGYPGPVKGYHALRGYLI